MKILIKRKNTEKKLVLFGCVILTYSLMQVFLLQKYNKKNSISKKNFV